MEDRYQRQRLEILRAAIRVISERGLRETRMADIADLIGVSAPSLLHYFPSKDAMLAEALAYADQVLFELAQNHLRNMQRARQQLRWFINHNMNLGPSAGEGWRQDWNLWIEVWARALHDESVATTRRLQEASWRQLVTEIVAAGQLRGEMTGTDPDYFATLLLSVMDGLAVQLALRDSAMTRKRAVKMCLDLVDVYLGPDEESTESQRREASPTAPHR